jgi:hypothetical protein
VGNPFREYLPVRINVGKTLAKLPRSLPPYYGEGAVEIEYAALLPVLVKTKGADVPISDTAALHASVHPM